MKTIAICRDMIEADIMRCRLAECGITARVLQRSEVSYLSSYLEAYSTFLMVEDDDYIKACEVLDIKPDIIRCPHCGSSDVTEDDTYHRNIWKRWKRYILHPSRVYLSCNDCHNAFYIES
ncbi:MAG: DUF2007 domain-containing protein [Flavobacteriales bacterium]|jgi:hypothetical protein|nr:DUF2007 domain-containing protein [Flavobacteriales bacterium]